MFKRIVLTVAVILLLSSGAFAIYQHKDFVLFSENIVERSGAIGLQYNSNLLPFSNIQINRDIGSGSIAMQVDRAIIGQRAGAWGLGGTSGTGQMGLGMGYQNQIVGHPAVVQQQDLGLGFAETMYKAGGIAGATGLQHSIAGRTQIAITPDDISRQSQRVFSLQFGGVVGSGDSNSSATQTLQVLTEQSQTN
ncbi:MAG: hypothetical protein ACE5NM_05090 [Sedimentisphaerales bacterium]